MTDISCFREGYERKAGVSLEACLYGYACVCMRWTSCARDRARTHLNPSIFHRYLSVLSTVSVQNGTHTHTNVVHTLDGWVTSLVNGAHTHTHRHTHTNVVHTLGGWVTITGHWYTHAHTNVVHTLGGWVTSLVNGTHTQTHTHTPT